MVFHRHRAGETSIHGITVGSWVPALAQSAPRALLKYKPQGINALTFIVPRYPSGVLRNQRFGWLQVGHFTFITRWYTIG